MINSRYDSHQFIDNVHFEYVAPGTSGSAVLMPVGELSMQIIEPGACYFLEKLKKVKQNIDVKSHSGVVYALKIFFVGRTPDNEVEIVDGFKPILLSLYVVDAAFSFKGAEYSMTFVTRNAMLAGRNEQDPAFRTLGFVNKNISINSKTTSGAVSELQDKLNNHYEETFKKEADKGPMRKVTYELSLDGKLVGDINTTNNDSRDPSEPSKMTFNAGKPITSMIMEIIRQSKTVNEKIAKSDSGINKPKHPGVFMPVIVPSVEYTESEAIVKIKAEVYEGGSLDEFEFDFFYSEAGKNVDILDFDMKFPNSYTFWVASENKYGSIFASNQNAEIPALSSRKFKDIVNKDESFKDKEYVEVEKVTLDGNSKDIAPLPAVPPMEGNQYNNTRAEDVPAARSAIKATSNFKISAGRTGTFILRIRGHAGLLDNQATHAGKAGYGVNKGLWIKVNIYDEEGRQFYYKDYYRCLSIVNKFSNGEFTQELGLYEMPDVS